MHASQRSGLDRTENAIARTLAERRGRGAPVLDLTIGNPTRCGIDYPVEAILRAIADPGCLRYAPTPFGLPEAREAVSAELARGGLTVPPDRIVLTASTSEAYAFLCKILCDPGDRIAVPRPGYPLFDTLLAFECVEPSDYRLAWDGAWHLDRASLRAAIDGRTRAIISVSPNNPTGSFLDREELSFLASLGLPVISDEVFAAYPFGADARRTPSALEEAVVPVFALGGLSKLAGLPQLKLGWIALGGPEADVAEALSRLELVADAWLSVATPVQLALPALLDAAGATRRSIRRRTGENLQLLRDAVGGTALSLLEPEGGWYATLRLPRTRSEEAWAVGLLAEDGVLVQPGWYYDFEGEAFLVLSLLTPPEDLARGVERIVARVEAS